MASLAASQAHTLGKTHARKRDEVAACKARLYELASTSDDHAIIGTLQQKLIGMKANYHAFTERYERAVEGQRMAQMQVHALELELDTVQRQHTAEAQGVCV